MTPRDESIRILIKTICQPIIGQVSSPSGMVEFRIVKISSVGDIIQLTLQREDTDESFGFTIQADKQHVHLVHTSGLRIATYEFELDDYCNAYMIQVDHRQRAIKAMTAYYDRAKKKLCDNNFSKN